VAKFTDLDVISAAHYVPYLQIYKRRKGDGRHGLVYRNLYAPSHPYHIGRILEIEGVPGVIRGKDVDLVAPFPQLEGKMVYVLCYPAHMGIIGIGCHQDFEGLHFEIILTESKGSQEIKKDFHFM